jgi:hypothetical protein
MINAGNVIVCAECGGKFDFLIGDRCKTCDDDFNRAYVYLYENSSVFRMASMDEQGRISTEVARMLIKQRKGESHEL